MLLAGISHTIQLQPLARMYREDTFIKGYKVDLDKITRNYGTREDDPDNSRFLPIWKIFPHPYLYIGGGMENDDIYVVVVLAEGLTREELEEQPIVALGEPYTTVFTPGIWVRF